MILLYITTSSKDQAVSIADYLLSEKLILDAVLIDSKKRKLDEHDKIVEEDQVIVLAKTKALLFDTIDKLLREKYTSSFPSLYSTPIVNMDWNQSLELKENIDKV